MEQETMLKEILHALNVHSAKMDERFDRVEKRLDRVEDRLDRVEERLDRVEQRLDGVEVRLGRMEKKMDGFSAELTETQETVEFTAAKTIQHESKLRKLTQQ